MKLLIIFLFFTSTAFAFTKADIHLNRYEFNRYVKPHLTSIVQDYYTLIILLTPEAGELKKVPSRLKKIKQETSNLINICKDKDLSKCKSKVLTIQKNLNEIDSFINAKDSNTPTENFNADNYLLKGQKRTALNKTLNSLSSTFESVRLKITLSQTLNENFHKIEKDIIIFENSFNNFLIKSSDNRFQDRFHAFWSQFIKPVNNIILPNSDMELFKNKLSDLNLSLHFMKVNLTKRNKKINKKAKTILNIIHNRWNNILKVSLRK